MCMESGGLRFKTNDLPILQNVFYPRNNLFRIKDDIIGYIYFLILYCILIKVIIWELN